MGKGKCAYQFCKHSGKDKEKIILIEKDGKLYHEDCLHEQEVIKKIIDYFYRYINRDVNFPVLQSVLGNIVRKGNYPADKLLFGMRYYVNNKIPIHYPQGLYYVIKNSKVDQAYNEYTAHKASPKVNIQENSDGRFTYNPSKQIGFGSILK